MKVQFDLVGDAHYEYGNLPIHVQESVDMNVEMECIPREGDVVDVPGISQGLTIVRTVVWYPWGSDEDSEEERHPLVYIVVGNPRL